MSDTEYVRPPLVSAETKRELADKLVAVSVSGGKDSAALSLWLTENGIDHWRIFMDTGWEHPATYEYLYGDLQRKIGPIHTIRAAVTFPELVQLRTAFPGGRTRFCTTVLKFEPIQQFIREKQDEGCEVVNAVGIRNEESVTRASATEWEWQNDLDCKVWRPLVRWTLGDVIAIHKRHDLAPNPLYLKGFTRVGCFPCINANKHDIALIARDYPGRIDQIRELERLVGERSNANPKPSMFSLRYKSDPKKHRTPVDDVVRWAQTDRYGNQTLGESDDTGCVRWGLCERSTP